MTAIRWFAPALALLLATAPLAVAQEEPAPQTEPAPMDAAELERTANLAADRLARNALIFVRGLEDPTAEDYRVVALTLEEAASIRPNDVELQRLLQEAWYAAGDQAKVIETTRNIIRLDPSDTVAQLRLISDRIRRYQSVEERQAAYHRLIVEGAASLDASVRSRLALDDALLARELGDNTRFIERLTLATQLDPTNKAAALLAATYTLERLDDPLARVEMLANVVLADPFDAATHTGLANELIVNGAFENARRFFQHAVALSRMAGRQPANELLLRVLLSTWAVDGSRELLDILEETERLERFQIRKQREAAEFAGEDPNQVPAYQPIPINESLRLAASLSINDRIVAQQALDRLKLMSSSAIAALQEMRTATPEERGGMTLDQIDATIREWRVSVLWNRLWSGFELDSAETTINELEAEVNAGFVREEAIQRYRGLLAAQRGDRETAESLLTPLSSTDPRARAGLGIAAERADDVRGAMRHYAQIALSEPGTMLGIWARKRIESILGQPLEPSATAQALEAYCRNLPQQIDRMIREPRSMIHLEAAHATEELSPFERIEVRVSVRNVSPIPLAVGPGAPISSDVLLSPRLTLGSNQVIEQIKPEVVSLDRRLRLLPGERVDAVVWAGQGHTGAVNDQALLTSALLRWRVVEGFMVSPDGVYVPSPLSLTADSRIVRRPPVQLPPGGAIRLPDWTREFSGVKFIKVLTVAPAALQFVQREAGDELALEVITGFAEALLDRLPSLSRYERSIVAQLLPSATATEQFQPVEDALRTDDDRLVRLTYLFVRTTSPDDPIFDLCAESDDPVIRAVAAQLRERIKQLADRRSSEAPVK